MFLPLQKECLRADILSALRHFFQCSFSIQSLTVLAISHTMDVGRVISDISLLDKVDSAGNIYYEFPDSHLFYSLEYINALVTKHVIISCKQFYDGICEARRRFIETHNAQHGSTWRVANLAPVMLRAVVKVRKVVKVRSLKILTIRFAFTECTWRKQDLPRPSSFPEQEQQNIYASCGFTPHH